MKNKTPLHPATANLLHEISRLNWNHTSSRLAEAVARWHDAGQPDYPESICRECGRPKE